MQNFLQSFVVFEKFGDELVLQRVLYELLLAETKLCLHQNSRLTVVEIQPDLGLFMNEKIRNIEIGQQLRPYVTISIDVNGRTNIFHARGQQLVIFFDSFVSTFRYLLSMFHYLLSFISSSFHSVKCEAGPPAILKQPRTISVISSASIVPPPSFRTENWL